MFSPQQVLVTFISMFPTAGTWEVMAITVLQASPEVRAMLHKVDTISPSLKPLPPPNFSLSLSPFLPPFAAFSLQSFISICSVGGIFQFRLTKTFFLSLTNLVTKLPLGLTENSRSRDRAECRRLWWVKRLLTFFGSFCVEKESKTKKQRKRKRKVLTMG